MYIENEQPLVVLLLASVIVESQNRGHVDLWPCHDIRTWSVWNWRNFQCVNFQKMIIYPSVMARSCLTSRMYTQCRNWGFSWWENDRVGCVCVCVWDGVGPCWWRAGCSGEAWLFVNIISEKKRKSKKTKTRLLFVECDVLPGILLQQCGKRNTFSFSILFHIFFFPQNNYNASLCTRTGENADRCFRAAFSVCFACWSLCDWESRANIVFSKYFIFLQKLRKSTSGV